MNIKQIRTDSFICVPIVEKRAEAFLAAISAASGRADAIELRMDYLDENERSIVQRRLPALAPKLNKPLIMTFRPREQGGMSDSSLQDRHLFWTRLPDELKNVITFADFELDLVESLGQTSDLPLTPRLPWSKIICSHHDFKETPGNLTEIYERMVRTPAAIIKIATQANRIGDCLRLFELIERKDQAKPVIVLGMGIPGLMTRVLALSRGAMLTFGALRGGAESAAGQPTVDDLTNLYRAKQLSRDSEIYGVIGKPIGHSRSPLLHNPALAALGLNGVYLPFEVDEVGEFIRDFVRPATRKLDWRLRGLSVTIPHKLTIIDHLDHLDSTARRIGAVNTVVVADRQLHGYNTDVIGAMKPLDDLIDVKDARVAVLGAGGAARAVCFGLSERGAAVTVFARDRNKARLLADEFGVKAAFIDGFDGQAEVVINCTPLGMRGHSESQSPIRAESLKGVDLVYDLIYNPQETVLLRDAQNSGCRTLGGLMMLVRQAAEQFRLWTELEAPFDVMWKAASG